VGELFEEQVELVREDDLRLLGRRLTPDFDDAEMCNGAGLVVATGADDASDDVYQRVVVPLAQAGYFVVAVVLTGAGAEAVDDLQAAVLCVKELARGRIGLLGLGGAATAALDAATVLPQLDAVVHAGGGPPSTAARLARVRAALLVHRVRPSGLFTDDDAEALVHGLARSHASLQLRVHDAADGFYVTDTSEGRIAREQTRAFLDLVLT
jgi:hypothetical protein